jgi:hypothetical protein
VTLMTFFRSTREKIENEILKEQFMEGRLK